MYSEATRLSLLASSSYALYLSSRAGLLFNNYRPTAEKAAKFSSTAKHDMQMTQKTVGLAIIANLFSLASLAYVSVKQNGWSGYIALFNTVLQCATYKTLQNYWKSQGTSGVEKLPGAGEYTDGWKMMQTVQSVQLVSGGLWTLFTMINTQHSKFA